MARIEPHCDLCAWILANEDAIKNGGIEYDGGVITEATEIVCYQWTVSLLFITITRQTGHQLKSEATGSFTASAMTLLFGWWGFPWGPIHTIDTLLKNGRGGVHTNVAGVIAQQRWDVTTLDGAMESVLEDSVAKFTDETVAEIENRRTTNGFDHDLAVKLMPDDAEACTCLIQFDYPVSDGKQLVYQTRGLTVTIDKRDRDFFEKRLIHFDSDDFLVVEVPADKWEAACD